MNWGNWIAIGIAIGGFLPVIYVLIFNIKASLDLERHKRREKEMDRIEELQQTATLLSDMGSYEEARMYLVEAKQRLDSLIKENH